MFPRSYCTIYKKKKKKKKKKIYSSIKSTQYKM